MSIALNENFNEGYTAFIAKGWVDNSAPFQFPLVLGGCDPAGLMASCVTGNADYTFAATFGPNIAVRAQLAVTFVNPSDEWEPCWVRFPGLDPDCSFIFGLGIFPDGHVEHRMNEVSSGIASPAGVVPVNGQFFAIQWRTTITGPYAAHIAVDVNNTTVWTSAYDWSSFASPPCLAGGANRFTGLSIFSIADPAQLWSAMDNLVVDTSAAKTAWPVCGAPPIQRPHPVATVTHVGIGSGPRDLVLTGTGFRAYSDPLTQKIFVAVQGPHGEFFTNNGDTSLTVQSVTATRIVVRLPVLVATGTWCATATNIQYCWET